MTENETRKSDVRGKRVEAVLVALASGARPRAWHLALALILCSPILLLLAFAHDLAINYTYHDVFIPLDAAWRTLQGQWPHTDFFSPVGLAYFWQHGAAAWLWGMDSRVVSRANFVALPFVLVPALMFSWRRLNAFSTVLLFVFLTVLIVSPIFLDGPERLVAYLANYNRLGSALCAVTALWALAAPRGRSAAWGLADAVAIGVTLLVLAFLKVTFFALAVAMVATGCVVTPRLWRTALVAGVVFAAGVVALELAHRGLLAAYAADLKRAGAANTIVFRQFYTSQAAFANLVPIALTLTMAAATAWIAPRQRWALAGIAGVAAACVLVSTQNYGAFSAPLVVLIMLLAERLRVGDDTGDELPATRPQLAIAGLFAVLMATVPFLLTHVIGTFNQARLNRSQGVIVGGGRSDVLRDMVWLSHPIENLEIPKGVTNEEILKWNPFLPYNVANAILTDGLMLLQRDTLTSLSIANLSFSNPFPAALHAPSPRGVALWWDQNRTYNVKFLTAPMVLGDAEVVMVPKVWSFYYNVTDLLSVAQSTLDKGYTPHQSQYWTAWVKKPAL
jgi:hypothetical protein